MNNQPSHQDVINLLLGQSLQYAAPSMNDPATALMNMNAAKARYTPNQLPPWYNPNIFSGGNKTYTQTHPDIINFLKTMVK